MTSRQSRDRKDTSSTGAATARRTISGEPGGFGETAPEVHDLHGLAAVAFDEIVERRGEHEIARARIEDCRHIEPVGADRMGSIRRLASGEHLNERRFRVGSVPRGVKSGKAVSAGKGMSIVWVRTMCFMMLSGNRQKRNNSSIAYNFLFIRASLG